MWCVCQILLIAVLHVCVIVSSNHITSTKRSTAGQHVPDNVHSTEGVVNTTKRREERASVSICICWWPFETGRDDVEDEANKPVLAHVGSSCPADDGGDKWAISSRATASRPLPGQFRSAPVLYNWHSCRRRRRSVSGLVASRSGQWCNLFLCHFLFHTEIYRSRNAIRSSELAFLMQHSEQCALMRIKLAPPSDGSHKQKVSN